MTVKSKTMQNENHLSKNVYLKKQKLRRHSPIHESADHTFLACGRTDTEPTEHEKYS